MSQVEVRGTTFGTRVDRRMEASDRMIDLSGVQGQAEHGEKLTITRETGQATCVSGDGLLLLVELFVAEPQHRSDPGAVAFHLAVGRREVQFEP